jgi:two-component system chemotaxis sensor kinase CheA
MFVLDDMDLNFETAPGSAPDTAATHSETKSVEAPRPALTAQNTAKASETANAETNDAVRVQSGAETVRVPAERLDELMDRVGELVIQQARLNQLAESSANPLLKGIAEDIGRLAAGLRDTTMNIRLVPIGSLFNRFRRLVRDLARDLGKPVDLITEGEETELDKTVIERLADPLIHIIRNSLDHGIESPEGRIAAAKPATGRLRLAARHAGAEVQITVSDDGRGLDHVKIRQKAEEAGLISPGALVPESELWKLIFEPGFSTAKEVSALSGRGVGMDVAKRTIEALRGSIDISTQQNRGTEITLRLPLTLAIIEGLLVELAGSRYVIPLASVQECVELPEAQGNDRNLLDIRGELVPFLRLRELFGTDDSIEEHQKVVVVASGEIRVGLVVDRIIGSHQTVIKSLSKLHTGVKTFSGATILPDGAAALILDIPQLIDSGQLENRHFAQIHQEAA